MYRQTFFAENGERYNVLGGISNSVICTCILFDYEVNEKVMAPNQWVVRVMKDRGLGIKGGGMKAGDEI